MADETQTYDLKLELKNGKLVVRGFEDVVKSQDKVRRANADTERSFTSLNRVAAGLFTAGTAAAIAYGTKKLVDLASAAEETQSKFDTVFRGMTGEANKWSTDFGREVGRSEQDVKRWMSTLQDTFVPLGFARTAAMGLSKDLTRLAVDLASFNNKADDEVLQNLTSAIVGNHEAVRSYGIVITEASLKQESLRQGLGKNVLALNEQQKAMLRYNIILRSSSDAQGDAVRTAGSYANQMKRLQANLTDVGTQIGTSLLPSFTAIAMATNDWIRNNKDLIETLSQIATFALGGGVAGVSQEAIAKQQYIEELESQIRDIEAAETNLAKSHGGFFTNEERLNERLFIMAERRVALVKQLGHAQNALIAMTRGLNRPKTEAPGDDTGGAPPPPPGLTDKEKKDLEKILHGKVSNPLDFTKRQIEAAKAARAARADMSAAGMSRSGLGITDVGDMVPEPGDLDLAYGAAYASAEGFRARMIPLMEEIADALPSNFERAADRIYAVTNVMQSSFDALFLSLVNGSGNAAEAMAAAMLRGVGQQAASEGQFYFLKGLAMMFIPGMQGNGAGLIGAGTALMALGAGLGALSSRLGGGGAGGYGGGSAGGYGLTGGAADRNAGKGITIVYYVEGGRSKQLDGPAARRVEDRVFQDREFAARVKQLQS